jgi:hypothetical protein
MEAKIGEWDGLHILHCISRPIVAHIFWNLSTGYLVLASLAVNCAPDQTFLSTDVFTVNLSQFFFYKKNPVIYTCPACVFQDSND